MDDRTYRERSDSEVESTTIETESWPEALADLWWAWLVAAGAVAVAAYFHLTESIWETRAEIFYAEIFALLAVVAVGYGLYAARERTSPL